MVQINCSVLNGDGEIMNLECINRNGKRYPLSIPYNRISVTVFVLQNGNAEATVRPARRGHAGSQPGGSGDGAASGTAGWGASMGVGMSAGASGSASGSGSGGSGAEGEYIPSYINLFAK
ncbi:hypothetical protein EVAR_76965_1 [Eumeta japonica]|uniref:Uncharacterized protein n=1 Tax=Eumeta variegata TaxID=151549 RepID=A0A4C1SHY9_EUMVA|nr:hypothetical protein EVAR_76965_1 [Eumeta japonica]